MQKHNSDSPSEEQLDFFDLLGLEDPKDEFPHWRSYIYEKHIDRVYVTGYTPSLKDLTFVDWFFLRLDNVWQMILGIMSKIYTRKSK